MEVSARLKFIREKFGLSQRELAKRAGVTNGTISLIEQNRVSPSVSSLKKVLEGIPMSLAEFFTFDLGEVKPSPFFDAEELPNLGNDEVQLCLVGSGIKDRNMCIMREYYQAFSDTGKDMLQHEGQEGGVVVRGEIEITVGAETRVLKAGDAYYFDSNQPHRFRNLTSEICEIVSANSPPTV
uniref:cupin domain-containing protein n=1 Tax=Leeia speluncae TaxID=2884804 RepID=UPI0035710CE7